MPDCGNTTTDGATTTAPADCGIFCVGDSSEICGGSDSLSLYSNGLALQPDPTFVKKVGAWNKLGCFK
jgi:hypothetical protein